ncbi:hypothetical protein KJ564_06690 [bacterium]|nr:hypothetical protein [bacterium]
MDKLSEIIKSPIWWVTVVIAGVAINIASAYLKITFDKSFFSIASWWRNRSVKRKEEFEKSVQRLSDDSHELMYACSDANNQLILAVVFILLGSTSSILGNFRDLDIFWNTLGSFCIFYGIILLLKQGNMDKMISTSLERRRQDVENANNNPTKN